MSQLPPILRDQRKIDLNHLNLLSIFHFIGAGLALVGILFLLGHFAIFNAVFSDPEMWEGQGQAPPPAEFFAVFKWFYVVAGIWFIGSGVLNVVAAICLRTRKGRVFTFVVAAVNCIYVPLGTVLGVFTIVVLARDSVRELYAAANGSGSPSSPANMS